jgi:glucan phosphoethanolaminetransferase (alkaline phosphatase superfamily)
LSSGDQDRSTHQKREGQMDERENSVEAVGGAVKLNFWVQAILMLLFGGLAAGMYWASLHGCTLGHSSETTTVATFLYIVFVAVAAYEFVSLAIRVFIRHRGGSPGEVKMLTGFIRVMLVLVLVFALIHSTGKLLQLGAVVGAFAGLLLG